MARHLIEHRSSGETRVVGDAALPFFPEWEERDGYTPAEPDPVPSELPDWWLSLKRAAEN
jgi:hypothetical protein